MSCHADKLAQVDYCLAGLITIMDRSPHADSYWPIFDRLEAERKLLALREGRYRAVKSLLFKSNVHDASVEVTGNGRTCQVLGVE